jgi:hypothetical protein
MMRIEAPPCPPPPAGFFLLLTSCRLSTPSTTRCFSAISYLHQPHATGYRVPPGEIERFLKAATSTSEELAFRLALSALSPGLRTDYNFRQRVNELLKTVPHEDVAALLADAARLESELSPSGVLTSEPS